MIRRPPRSTLFPYTTLFRSRLILGITMGAQPPLGVPGQVRLVAGSEFDLENLVCTQSGRADGWSGVIDEHEGALQCLRMTTLRARTVVPRSEERRVGKECRSRWS